MPVYKMEKNRFTTEWLKLQLQYTVDVRRILAQIERNMPPEKQADLIISILADSDEKTKETAIALAEIAYSNGNNRILNKKLAESLSSEDTVLKKSVLIVFSKTEFGPAKEIAVALGDPDPGIRMLAAGALGEIKDPLLLPDLAAHLADDDEDVKAAVRRALYSMSWVVDRTILEGFISLLKTENRTVRDVIITCIENIQNREKIPLLLAALKHDESVMRINAAAALAKIARFSTKEEIVALYLSEKNEQAKTEIGNILAGIGSNMAIDLLDMHTEEHDITTGAIFAACMEAVRALPDINEKLSALNSTALGFIKTGKRKEAVGLLNEIYTLIHENRNLIDRAGSMIAFIRTYAQLSNTKKIQILLTEALEAAQNTGNKLHAAGYCMEIGKLYRDNGDSGTATTLFSRALVFSLQGKKELPEKQIIVQADIAAALLFSELHDQAIAALKRCRDSVSGRFLETGADPALFIQAVGRTALGYAKAGLFRDALSLVDTIDEPMYTGELHAEIGVLGFSSESKDISPKSFAAKCFTKAVKYARELYDLPAQAEALVRISEQLYKTGDLKKPGRLLEEALHITRHQLEEPDSGKQAMLLEKIAEAFILCRDTDRAYAITGTITDAAARTRTMLGIIHALFGQDSQFKRIRTILEECEKSARYILRSREQSLLLAEAGLLYNRLGEQEIAAGLVRRAYILINQNRDRETILAGLAPLLVGML